MITREEKRNVVLEVQQDALNEFVPQLETKTSKKNDRNLEDLESSIFQGFEDFHNAEEKDSNDWTIEKYKRRMYWYVQRSAFFYINEPLAYSIVRTFNNLELPEDEKVAAAKVGLMVAFEKFDPTRGFQFSTYAWKLISNEIIAANKLRKRADTVTQAAHKVRAKENAFIVEIEEAKGGRKILVNNKKVDLFNIRAVDYNGSEKIYEFLYHLPKNIIVGAELTRGQIVGTSAGAETKVASFDQFQDGEDNREPIVTNTTTKIREDDIRADLNLPKKEIISMLYEGIHKLTKQEQLVITKRFLVQKKVNRVEISKELGISEYKTAKLEAVALSKLKGQLGEQGINLEDILL